MSDDFDFLKKAWTPPSKEMPPLHTQVLIAIKGGGGGDGEVLDVACYAGKEQLPDRTVDRWIGTGNFFETHQIKAWMTIHTMMEVEMLARRIAGT